MQYRLTSRPTPIVWLSGQYRLYDYDNRTPHFPVDEYVRLDGNVATSATGGSEPFGYRRQFVDLDASFTPLRFTAFRDSADSRIASSLPVTAASHPARPECR